MGKTSCTYSRLYSNAGTPSTDEQKKSHAKQKERIQNLFRNWFLLEPTNLCFILLKPQAVGFISFYYTNPDPGIRLGKTDPVLDPEPAPDPIYMNIENINPNENNS